MTIKHLVIPGGGPVLLPFLAGIQYLEQEKFIDLNNIESIYGTSAGGIIGTLLCLKFDWETINDYIIKRPWHDVFQINVQSILDSYSKKGVFDSKIVEKCFKPLLDAKDMSMDITLKELYEYSKIELHMFSFDINDFQLEDISYLTHPDLKLLTAIQMTSGLPILMSPLIKDNKCYIDGGVKCNCPLNICIETKGNPDEILVFKNKYNDNKTIIDENSTIFDFLMVFIYKMILSLSTENEQQTIKNEIYYDVSYLTFEFLKSAIISSEARRELFNGGINDVKNFLSKLKDSV